MAKERKIFNTVANPELIPYDPLQSGQKFGAQSMSELSMGFGSKVMRADQQGFWLGANNFLDAPTRIDMDGNFYSKTVTTSDDEGFIEQDGHRIQMFDGETYRLLLGEDFI